MPDVSAVIVGWNPGDSLAACCRSLRVSARQTSVDLQLVVVDNASTDGSLAGLSLEKTDVCVRNPVNAGYSVAATQGMARAGAPWILLVNPDLVVAPEFFQRLAHEVEHAPETVATLVPEMRFASLPNLVNCRGVMVDEIGIPAEVDAGVEATARPPSSEKILGGSSGCCLLRVSAVKELGGPEPMFFAYLEDVDLALRLSRAGHGTILVPTAVAWHEGSASTGGRSPLKTFLVARNRRLLFRLHGPRSRRARIWRTAIELGHGIVSSRYGLTAPWTGRLDALRLRRYTAFIRRSRTSHDPNVGAPKLSPRVTLRETLRRKRAIHRAIDRH